MDRMKRGIFSLFREETASVPIEGEGEKRDVEGENPGFLGRGMGEGS
jgi:hypothetical protein